jgi:hypothetical protein
MKPYSKRLADSNNEFWEDVSYTRSKDIFSVWLL